jgi:hypothetical protein
LPCRRSSASSVRPPQYWRIQHVMKSTELTKQSRCISAPSSMRSRDNGSLVLRSSTQHEYFQSLCWRSDYVSLSARKKNFGGQLWGHRRLIVKTTYRNNRWLWLLCSCSISIRLQTRFRAGRQSRCTPKQLITSKHPPRINKPARFFKPGEPPPAPAY